jgi:hypothetical protein
MESLNSGTETESIGNLENNTDNTDNTEIPESIDERIIRFLSNPLEYQIQHIFVNTNMLELINNRVRVPDGFWDPVVVSLSDHSFSLITNKLKKQDCVICNETEYNFKVVPCCKNDLCTSCATSWFNKSVKCPYCNQDIRDFI